MYKRQKYANGLDDSPVMRSDYVSPVKSIGHGITTVSYTHLDVYKRQVLRILLMDISQEDSIGLVI